MKINSMKSNYNKRQIKKLFEVALVMAFMFVITMPPVFAQSLNSTSYCIDDSTLFSITSFITKTGNQPAQTTTINQSSICPTGCSSNSCNPPSYTGFLVVGVIAIISISIYFFYLKPKGLP